MFQLLTEREFFAQNTQSRKTIQSLKTYHENHMHCSRMQRVLTRSASLLILRDHDLPVAIVIRILYLRTYHIES